MSIVKRFKLVVAAISCAGLMASHAADSPPTEIDFGPFFSGTIKAAFPGANTTMKGVTVKLGPAQNKYLCFDTELLRVSIAWEGEFLNFGMSQYQIQHPQPPDVKGNAIFGTKPGPGWSSDGSFADPRPTQQGPLPKTAGHYRGLYVTDRRVVLSYTVGNCGILEHPSARVSTNDTTISRTFQLDPSTNALTLLVLEQDGVIIGPAENRENAMVSLGNNMAIVASIVGPDAKDFRWQAIGSRLEMTIPPSTQKRRFRLDLRKSTLENLKKPAAPDVQIEDLEALAKTGKPRWTEPVMTALIAGTNEGPYKVDQIAEPFINPWLARTFLSGFDFLPDGNAAVSTFHGDVWIVSVGSNSEKVSWKRFATGLFQPLGVKVVDGKIYVLGRDQITRLEDVNRDGEADFYENFNNDTFVTLNYHEFSLDLQTDRAGNFYFAKGAPWPPQVESPHQGTVIRISKDGSKLDVVATGLRAPNGMAIGPNDEITVSDNQGHWIPASKLNIVREGKFYGMMPTAHRRPQPADFEKPLFWLPMNVDNSSGGQAWVTSDKWGPFENHLLFTSYGKATLFHVMQEEVEGVLQASVVAFPFKFQSGVMRARFSPKDGQLYVCGLRGWQTSGTKDGGFYRVRYVEGQPVQMPLEVHALQNGMLITFTSPLDKATAASADNYSAEQWNYKWSGEYGSPDLSVRKPNTKGRDKLEIRAAQLSSDGKSVLLEIPGMSPADQMRIKFNIKSADGRELSDEIYSTIYKLGKVRTVN